MINRRHFLILAAASVPVPLTAHAQATEKAAAFVKSTGDRLVAVVNGSDSAAAKRAGMTRIIDTDIDVEGIGQFCLGRFWRQASPDQQKRYLDLFRQVLVINITSKLGEYKGVTFTMGRSKAQDDEAVVSTTVTRPNNAPTAVDWLISNPSSNPKIVDVLAEGTSLRLTQRQDYASYLVHNNNNIDALIAAMKTQTEQGK